jgi:hypothetical protein
MLHGSEVAYWRDGKTTIAGALQAVPEHLDNTWVVFESTANGAQGWFYNECMAALQGDSEWKLHFYAWWWDDDYKLPLEPGEVIEYTDEEQALADKHGLTPEQIKWRRKKIRDLKGRFQQEYPETPEAAFIHSGRVAFPRIRSAFYSTPEASPIEGDVYIAGADWGQDPDFTALSIFNQTKQREVFVGRWRRMSHGSMRAAIIEKLQYWNVKGIVPERNSLGDLSIEDLYNDCVTAGLSDILMKPFWSSNPSKHNVVKLLEKGTDSEGVQLLDDPVANAEIVSYQQRQLESGVYKYTAPDTGDENKDEESVVNDDTVIARLLAWYGCNYFYF